MGRRSRWVGPPRPQTLPNEGGAPLWALPLRAGVSSTDFKHVGPNGVRPRHEAPPRP